MDFPHLPPVRIASPAGLLAVVPYLIGFHPSHSLVLIGVSQSRHQVRVAVRYDLPDPPDPQRTQDIAEHAAVFLTGHHLTEAVAVGYGSGHLVSPVADAILGRLPTEGINVYEMLRAEQGRYWSYVCADPTCCPADGVPFDQAAHPAAVAMVVAGRMVVPDRAALAATMAPPTGPAAESIRAAVERAEVRVRNLAMPAPDRRATRRLLYAEGCSAVGEAMSLYRGGGTFTSHDEVAWLAVSLQSLPVRDHAWARMDPAYCHAHRRLWIDVTRRVPDAYLPAPASLLAFTAWQSGDGVLANIAVDRALAAAPNYSMAQLLQHAINAGMPPPRVWPPIIPSQADTPDEATPS